MCARKPFVLRCLYVAIAVAVAQPASAASVVKVIAETGFNDAVGINANGVANSPYSLNLPLPGQGGAEPGWANAWQGHPDYARVSTARPWEGDGQATMLPTSNTLRAWNVPQSGSFVIDQYLRLTANSQIVFYIENSAFGTTNIGQGPVALFLPSGAVAAVFGTRDGCDTCPSQPTGFHWTPGEWHRLSFLVDVPAKSYDLYFDGVKFATETRPGFRGSPTAIDRIRYQPEASGAGIDLDALRILDLGAPTAGDTDGDGDVDIDDLNNVRNDFGTGGFLASGDAYPFDGVVDLADVNLVRNHFGTVSQSAVPEPATRFLAASGVFGLLLHQRLARRRTA